MVRNSFLDNVYKDNYLVIPAIAQGGVSQLSQPDLTAVSLSGNNPADISSVLSLTPEGEATVVPEIANAVDFGQLNATANDAAVEGVGDQAADVANATEGMQGWLGAMSKVASGFKPDNTWTGKTWSSAQLRAPSMILGR